MNNKNKLFSISLFVLGLTYTLFHMYTALQGPFPAYQQRVIHLSFALAMASLLKPVVPIRKPFGFPLALTMVFVMLGIGFYGFNLFSTLWLRAASPRLLDLIVGGLLIFFLIDSTRRMIGWPLPILAILSIIYAVFGQAMPGIIAHRGYDFARIIDMMFLGTSGIFGTPLGVSSTYIAIFVIFAAMFDAFGAGKVFIDATQAIIGWSRGGAAKVAVLASALFGTISGSAIANTVATGAFTIPLMKKSGFKPHFAAAVEAAASGGGQLMPPVMGAAAFIMADILGSYQLVLRSGIIPALLFFVALFIMIDLEAAKTGLKGLERSKLPVLRKVLLQGWYLLVPIAVLIYMLVIAQYSPPKSAIWSIITLLIIVFARLKKRPSIEFVLHSLSKASEGIVGVALATACAGILIGVLFLSGLGFKLSSVLIAISGGNVLILLFFTMIASIVLGMGMPTSGAYVILAVLVAPALVDMGLSKIAAHFFVFYFGIMANVTPPVAIAAYAAAGIAGADAMRTGFTAWRLSLVGFLLPFMFALNPALLAQGSLTNIFISVTITIVGLIALAAMLQAYFLGRLYFWQRVILFIGSLSLLFAERVSDTIGLTLVSFIFIIQLYRRHNKTQVSKEK